jgi:hypothetical protein
MRARTRNTLSLLVGAVAVAACSDPQTPTLPTRSAAHVASTPRSDGYIVVLKSGGARFNRVSAGVRLGDVIPLDPSSTGQDAIVTDVVPSINGIVVRGAASANDISGDDVEEVIPNYVAEISDPAPDASMVASPDFDQDPTGTDQAGAFFFANNTQWSYKKVSANRVWVPSRGGAGAKVCITDSGIDIGHAGFVGKPIEGASFIVNSSAFTDTAGHGSHVAGTVSTNGAGGASVAPDVSLMMAKVFNGVGGGASTAVVLNAVAWCTDNGADVINMSLGFTGGIPTAANQAFIAAYQAGLDYATSRGVLIVASAGKRRVHAPSPRSDVLAFRGSWRGERGCHRADYESRSIWKQCHVDYAWHRLRRHCELLEPRTGSEHRPLRPWRRFLHRVAWSIAGYVGLLASIQFWYGDEPKLPSARRTTSGSVSAVRRWRRLMWLESRH